MVLKKLKPGTPTPEMLAKLPAWAKDYVSTIEHQRNAALRSLEAFQNEQTKSLVYFDKHVCLGKHGETGPTEQRCYIQSDRIKFSFKPDDRDLLFETEVYINEKEKRIEIRTPRGYPYLEPAGHHMFYITGPGTWNPNQI
jgi:hypothetical protein